MQKADYSNISNLAKKSKEYVILYNKYKIIYESHMPSFYYSPNISIPLKAHPDPCNNN